MNSVTITKAMRVIGLTGGIASGKSTTARLLRDLGAHIVDADQLARDVVMPGQPALAEIARLFGPEMITPEGTLDRKRLGALVFGDADKRRQLEAITHPRIALLTQQRLEGLRAEGVPVAIYEAALLVENGTHRGLEGLIVTSCDEATQIARMRARDGLSEAEARARIAAQLPLAAKVAVADWVIDTCGPIPETQKQVASVWAEILAGGARKT
jgi:dephospho-CoA kinase